MIHLTEERLEKIKEIVANTFEKYSINCVPISGFEMATKIGAKIIPYSSKPKDIQDLMYNKSEDGFSALYDGVWYIFYNDFKNYGRTNNTLAHECGHIILDHTENSELAEAEAKFFAKYSLAPPVLIHKLQLKNWYEVYRAFDISQQAAYYAYSYYEKWLNYGNDEYTNYEIKLLKLFSNIA